MRLHSRTLCHAVIGTMLMMLWPGTAHAIPAFARKYQTSCQTCHIAFPKLNPFGEAFRLRGYRMPAETEDLIKEKPVALGAPAYKRVWPQAVWPSDVPGTVPVSVGTIFSDVTHRTTTDGAVEKFNNDFHFPEEVAILSGGTLGETLSFFGELTFQPTVDAGVSSVEVGIEQGQLSFNGPFGSGPRFNLKVGRFRPESSRPFMENSLLTIEGPAAFFAFNPIASHGGSAVGDEGPGIAVPETVDGVEAYGVLGHRFLYSGGLANGIGPGQTTMDGNSAKDVYGRVAYKVGGLALDGDGYQPSENNWQERSLKVGAFAYRGDGGGILFSEAEGLEPGQMLEDRRFTRVGVDANLFFDNANVITGYVRGRDELNTFDSETALLEQGDFTYHTWFAEGDYVFLPWLQGVTRYEWLRPAQAGAPDFKRIVPGVTALVRANVKAYLEYERDLGVSNNYVLIGGMRFAF